jgi:hypothetical protein
MDQGTVQDHSTSPPVNCHLSCRCFCWLLLQLPSLAPLAVIQDPVFTPGTQLLPMAQQDLLLAVMGVDLSVWDMNVSHSVVGYSVRGLAWQAGLCNTVANLEHACCTGGVSLIISTCLMFATHAAWHRTAC